MFKIGKLFDVESEKITIDYVNYNIYRLNDNNESVKTLAYRIEGKKDNHDFSFEFSLNCDPKELLKIKPFNTVDFSSYVTEGETIFSVDGISDINPITHMKITRYIKNKFVINIDFSSCFTDCKEEADYLGMLEIKFDLDLYI